MPALPSNYVDASHENPALSKRLSAIYARKVDKPINLNLEPDQPYLQMLARLGNPHTKCPPIIHIAGTNGKGSTLAFLQAMLESAGKSVHKLTSPHLIHFNERVVLNGQEISDDTLIDLLDRIEEVIGDLAVTFFEYTTALAFLAASERKADYLLLETGLGGRFDATNVIQNPHLTMISSIDMDHMEYLGDTVEKIAFEKAGILKENSTCILMPQHHTGVEAVIKDLAQIKGCEVIIAESTYPDHWPEPVLRGKFQHKNALLAASAARHLGIDEAHIKQGLQNVKWPGRLDLMGYLDGSTPLYYDGGHNLQAAQAIASQIKLWQGEGHDVHAIIGIASNKDSSGYIDTLNKAASSTTLIDLPSAIAPSRAVEIHERLPKEIKPEIEAGSTLQKAIQDKEGLILVCGSLYLYKAIKNLANLASI